LFAHFQTMIDTVQHSSFLIGRKGVH
jgi:hypothetical protein